MLNKCNILALADVIEKMPEEKFDMGSWGHTAHCGTVACIAGWAYQMTPEAERADDERETGKAKLGLTNKQSEQLFLGCEDGHEYDENEELVDIEIDIPLESITNKWAAACLRNLADTGRVEWTKTKPE